MLVHEWLEFVFRCRDCSRVDQDYMFKMIDNVLGILGGLGYLKGVMNQVYVIVMFWKCLGLLLS